MKRWILITLPFLIAVPVVAAVKILGSSKLRGHSGIRTADACIEGVGTVGSPCPGGSIYAGVLNGYSYMVTPGGCTDSATPSCAGGADTVTRTWGLSGSQTLAQNAADGYMNTITADEGFLSIMAAIFAILGITDLSDSPAATYCRDMVFGGYDDWFLPAQDELVYFQTNAAALGGFVSTDYWSSYDSGSDYSLAAQVHMGTGATSEDSRTSSARIRCARLMRTGNLEPVDWDDFDEMSDEQYLEGFYPYVDLEITVVAISGTPTVNLVGGGGMFAVGTLGPGTKTFRLMAGMDLVFQVWGPAGSTAQITVKDASRGYALVDVVTGNAASDGCGGELISGGRCVHIGGFGQSCTDVCSYFGGYNASTRSYIGDTGTLAGCQEASDALAGGLSGSNSNTCTAGVGCHQFASSGLVRCTNMATTEGAVFPPGDPEVDPIAAYMSLFTQRICICNY